MLTKDNIKEKLVEFMKEYPDFDEKIKFGSKAYERQGNMCAGVYQNQLVLNLGKEKVNELLKSKYAKPMDIIGRLLEDWVILEEPLYQDTDKTRGLLKSAVDRVRLLPRK